MRLLVISLLSIILWIGLQSCGGIAPEKDFPFTESISLRLNEGETLIISDSIGQVVQLQLEEESLRVVAGQPQQNLYTYQDGMVYLNQAVKRERGLTYRIE